MVSYIKLKDFDKSISGLYRHGGQKRKLADKVSIVFGKLSLDKNPFEGIATTKHGESRIRHCVKYSIGAGHRLITIQEKNYVAFCFVGDHDDCDRWIEGNSGLKIAKEDQSLVPVFVSTSADHPLQRAPVPTRDDLIGRLEPNRLDELLNGAPPSVIGAIYQLGQFVSTEEIESVCASITDLNHRLLIRDVVSLLACGDIQGANRRLDIEKQAIIPVEELDPEELLQVQDGDEIRQIRVGSKEHEDWLQQFTKNAEFIEWLLFMHPEQEAVVREDFDGPCQLSGVSGSGKTCIIVRRAVRLAEANQDTRVLIVTLNRSLAGLIEHLVTQAAENEAVAQRIEVRSFFGVCQRLLHEFEPKNRRLYDDVTWKLDEHIDEIFREYYRCWHNYDAAEALLPIHMSLVSQGVNAESYLREELDWIRSAIPSEERDQYLSIPRTGRKHPIPERWRERILKGLQGWEQKMQLVGVIDYLGLTTHVSKHQEELRPRYNHILVDEAQDFGTAELAIIRKLVAEGQNDIFLSGDVAQHVLPKHRILAQAGIDTVGRSRRIIRNYRNSREILKAAYSVLIENLSEELIDDSDMEILDPKYSNRSSPQPVVLEANNLTDELGFARSLIRDHLESNRKDRCCIAIAGYSTRELQPLASELNLPILDGTHAPVASPLVLSDLEQTKGYEFNIMVIVNCCENILPPKDVPESEAFRHGCRLYVTMTRARDELYLSYNGVVSKWLEATRTQLEFIAWTDVVELDQGLLVAPPPHLLEFEDHHEGSQEDYLSLNGRQFIYSPAAIGLSSDALLRIDDLVDGRGLLRDGRRQKWRDIASFYSALEREPYVRRLLGPILQEEIRNFFSNL